jgi:alpha-methylacyl-CoA racemase
MVDGVATLMAAYYGMVPAGTWRDHRHDNLLDGAAHFYSVYETADGKHVAIGAMESQFYEELCERLAVAVPHDLDNPSAWGKHRQTLADRFGEKTRAQWERVLTSPGSCAAPVLSIAEAPHHPHNVARATFVEVDGVLRPAPAPRFSRTVPPVPTPPSLPGDHMRDVLTGIGLDDNAIAELVDAGVARQSTGDPSAPS